MMMTREMVDKCTILLAEVGSSALGVTVADTDDLDLMGICVEPADYVVGLSHFEHLQDRRKADGSTQPDGARSGPGDIDKITYSLRKWMRLALKGNPSVLLPLFSPTTPVLSEVGKQLCDNADKFVSQDSGNAFLNYLRSQRTQLTGERPKKHTNRPELVEKYGYDTKFAYHALRLGIQGIEFMETGTLRLPMRDMDREELLAIRCGELELAEVVSKIDAVESALVKIIQTVPNVSADAAWANEFLKVTYADAWGW